MRRNIVLLLFFFSFATSSITVIKPIQAVETNSWESKAPMNQARAYLGVAVVNGKIYAIGGDTSSIIGNVCPGTSRSNQLVCTNEVYDPAMNKWTTKTPMPTARALFGTAVYQDKIYCIGGYDNNYTDLSVNEVYDPATNSWYTKTAMPTPAYGVLANAVGSKIYVIGGATTIGSVGSNVNYVYNPATDSWASKTPPPYDITSLSSSVVGDKIYCIGALTDASGLWNGTFIIQTYDTLNDSWRIVATSPRAYTSGNGGGVTSGVYAPQQIYFFDDITTYVYDLTNNNWTVGVPMPTARTCVGVAVVNDTFYVIGGRSGMWGYITIMDASAVTEQYVPFGYKMDVTPPKITMLSPENKTYYGTDVPLNFTVDEPVSSMGYSLNGDDNVTIAGNMTLNDLPNGAHNLTVYATDRFGNTAASETIHFNIAAPEPFPTVPVAAGITSTAAVCIGALIYLKKRRR